MSSSPTRRSGRIAKAFGAVLLVGTLLTVPLLTAHPATASTVDDPEGAGTVSVSGRPADAEGRPDGRTRFSYAADPGQTVTDRFLVGNRGSARQDFTVYGTDAFNSPDGGFALLSTSEEPVAIGAWTRFENGEPRIQFSLEPGEVRVLPFTIDFPAEATPGDHVGGIVASVVEAGTQVNVDRRVATAVYARVSGELQPRLVVSEFEATHVGDWWNPFSGSVLIRYTVENPGNVALAANVTMGVDTWFGIPATQAQGGSVPDILPGNSAAFEFEAGGVAQWLYLLAHVRLNPFVDDPDTAKQLPVPATTRDVVTWAVPWTVLILIVLAAGIAAAVWWKRRRDDEYAREWLEKTQSEARAAAQREVELVAAGKAPTND
ncbi:hypothetical protein [Microbacterium sp. SLBN-146]|uniref:hypothetical protein n=1 Tax=Microbacterium sp. SLBN-146 TaxID=2768457 RepID=UPI00114D8951|nr:hypothetical protein [Microbacterium sp. SLBN-146]TQJ31358.1 hypothetical protein FBY39_1825 [Microbacterium sp. SLBN-146]